jgi:hypothetical protein
MAVRACLSMHSTLGASMASNSLQRLPGWLPTASRMASHGCQDGFQDGIQDGIRWHPMANGFQDRCPWIPMAVRTASNGSNSFQRLPGLHLIASNDLQRLTGWPPMASRMAGNGVQDGSPFLPNGARMSSTGFVRHPGWLPTATQD